MIMIKAVMSGFSVPRLHVPSHNKSEPRPLPPVNGANVGFDNCLSLARRKTPI